MQDTLRFIKSRSGIRRPSSAEDARIQRRAGLGAAMQARQAGRHGLFLGIQRRAWLAGHAGNLARSLSIA